jgi:hypothetical protein
MSAEHEAQTLADALHPGKRVRVSADGPGRWVIRLRGEPSATVAADTREAAWGEAVRGLRMRIEMRIVAVEDERERLTAALAAPSCVALDTLEDPE